MSALFCNPLSAKERYIRWAVLGLGLAPVMGAFSYTQELRIPLASCLFQGIFGFPGPGCGLTRSFMALARGEWQQALMFHLFGPLLFAICAIAVLQTGTELLARHALSGFTGKSLTTFYYQLLQQKWFVTICLLLLLSYYLLRLYARYGVADLPFSMENSSAWQLLVAGAKAL